jgi:hypothetical protein
MMLKIDEKLTVINYQNWGLKMIKIGGVKLALKFAKK